ncbi:venom toxin OcyC11 isoform X1 [Drosophila guanche]|uniref:venom toxin OcyC11 isoform X1 n=2 Tax=Drosophila guanche TaxID=7266 RepID=UPI001470F5F6|nr:venom toxin OcyC11 isoform X1 [Drosophila guanche]
MKSLTFVLCLLVLGAHSLLALAVDCDFEGHKLNTGESYKPNGQCMQYTCEGPKQLIGKNCPMEAHRKRCKLVGDVTKPYPQCCPKFQC